MPDFLLEIGCEEIPARMLDAAANSLAGRVAELCFSERISAVASFDKSFATPRRLAIWISNIRAGQSDSTEKKVGPPAEIALKEGKPTKAAEAFLKSVGFSISELQKALIGESAGLKIEQTQKGKYLVAYPRIKGRRSLEILAELLPKEIASLYWPKNMYWRAGAPERFVRPIRWIVAMLDGEVIPLEFAGVKAGNTTRGHRFVSDGINIGNAADYEKTLERAKVIADSKKREERIRKALDAATRAIVGARWREDKQLLETVVNLTEWPGAVLGSFEKQFLELPEEVLVTVMRDHQKYFAVEDAQGKLAPHFLAVLNTDGDPDGLIRHGNERVLRARFNDARFFWQTDQKIPLKQRIDMLKAVTFQKDLGSYYEKTERVRRLAEKIAEELADSSEIDPAVVGEAAWLAKADLTTELVKEFTELQGVVGGLYARAQGLGEPVAQAIYDQYKPQSMDDTIPKTLEGAVLSLADKADTIAGMFALGLQPTGSKDPFALRRQANGIVRILAEHKLDLGIHQLFEFALEGYKHHPKVKIDAASYGESVRAFMRERLEFYLRESKAFAYDEVNAVLAAGADDVSDAVERIRALHEVRASQQSAELEAVCVSFKRIKNILRQAAEKQIAVPERPEERLLGKTGSAEADLWIQGAVNLAAHYQTAQQTGNYKSAIAQAASLRPLLDKFFEDVMVMVEDEKVRANRLALLARLLANFSTIADFSEIVTEGKA